MYIIRADGSLFPINFVSLPPFLRKDCLLIAVLVAYISNVPHNMATPLAPPEYGEVPRPVTHRVRTSGPSPRLHYQAGRWRTRLLRLATRFDSSPTLLGWQRRNRSLLIVYQLLYASSVPETCSIRRRFFASTAFWRLYYLEIRTGTTKARLGDVLMCLGESGRDFLAVAS